MGSHIVRQPILNEHKELLGYELLYQEDAQQGLYNSNDTAAATAIESLLQSANNSLILEGRQAFVTFTPNLLLKRIPSIFTPDKLVIQIDDGTTINPLAQKTVYEYHKKGYKIAMQNFEFSPRYFSFLDVVDYIKIDMKTAAQTEANITQIGKSFNKTMIAYNVSTPELFELAKSWGCEYFQGPAVAAALSSHVQNLQHLKSNFFMLMVAVTKDEPDVDEIAEIISRDVTLTFALLRLVNSAYFALRNRVNSVKQALVVLGLGQLKHWIYLLSFRGDQNELSDDLIKTSFLRGNICSELSTYMQGVQLAKADAYLMGMFSTLDLLLEVPLETALAELPLDENVKLALISGTGPYAALHQLVLSYESANWKEAAGYAAQLGIPENIVAQKYFECMENVNSIWKNLMDTQQQ